MNKMVRGLYFETQTDIDGNDLVEVEVHFYEEVLCIIHVDDIDKFAEEFYAPIDKYRI